MATVFLPSQLQSYSGGASRVTADGGSVAEVLSSLDGLYPGIRFRVIDEQDRIRKHMRVYVGQDRVFDIARPLAAGEDEVLIFGALSGG